MNDVPNQEGLAGLRQGQLGYEGSRDTSTSMAIHVPLTQAVSFDFIAMHSIYLRKLNT